jgi:DNA topoisomerase-6 subunit B
MLIKMIEFTGSPTLQHFLMNEFSRVSANNAKNICEEAAVLPTTKPKKITREMSESIMRGIKKTKLISPPTDCINPIGETLIEKGLKKEINAEFFASVTRQPKVYRGNPFIIEAGLAYGGDLNSDGAIKIMRFANRVPLLYQQGACAITDSIQKTGWRPYGLNQSRGSIPQGPVVLMVHMASVWVPFTNEAKDALAHYPEIIKEIKLAISDVGRKLASYVNKKKKVKDEFKKRSYIEKYIPHVAIALNDLLTLDKYKEEDINIIIKNLV